MLARFRRSVSFSLSELEAEAEELLVGDPSEWERDERVVFVASVVPVPVCMVRRA
jgi:hypothetical protein